MNTTQQSNPYLYDLTAKQYIEQGIRCMKEHLTHKAIYAFECTLAQEPNNVEAHYNIALAQSKIAAHQEFNIDSSQAIGWYNKATDSVTLAINLMGKEHSLFIKAHKLNRSIHASKKRFVISTENEYHYR